MFTTRTAASAFALSFTAGTALVGTAAADVTTETVAFDYDPNQGTVLLDVQGFDTMGGTRVLNSASFQFNHNFSADLFIESTGPTALAAGDFFIDVTYISLFQLGLANDGDVDPDDDGDGEGPSGPPFFGPGAFFAAADDFALDAYDGTPGNDGPDSYREAFSDSYSNTLDYAAGDGSGVIEALTGGPLTAVYGGFTEFFGGFINDPGWPAPSNPFGLPSYPDDAAVWTSLQNFNHSGDFVITYDFTVIPAPASITAFAGLGLLARRRR